MFGFIWRKTKEITRVVIDRVVKPVLRVAFTVVAVSAFTVPYVGWVVPLIAGMPAAGWSAGMTILAKAAAVVGGVSLAVNGFVISESVRRRLGARLSGSNETNGYHNPTNIEEEEEEEEIPQAAEQMANDAEAEAAQEAEINQMTAELNAQPVDIHPPVAVVFQQNQLGRAGENQQEHAL